MLSPQGREGGHRICPVLRTERRAGVWGHVPCVLSRCTWSCTFHAQHIQPPFGSFSRCLAK